MTEPLPKNIRPGRINAERQRETVRGILPGRFGRFANGHTWRSRSASSLLSFAILRWPARRIGHWRIGISNTLPAGRPFLRFGRPP